MFAASQLLDMSARVLSSIPSAAASPPRERRDFLREEDRAFGLQGHLPSLQTRSMRSLTACLPVLVQPPPVHIVVGAAGVQLGWRGSGQEDLEMAKEW